MESLFFVYRILRMRTKVMADDLLPKKDIKKAPPLQAVL